LAQCQLNSRNWASAIEGLAGTAKTTTVGAIRDFVEGRGYNVRGFGMTSGSVKALREAGVNARTIASLLQNPLPPRTGPELWIVDESSLLATRPTNRILKAARQQGVERILFVGDQRQHHPIEAGAPVRQLFANNMAVAGRGYGLTVFRMSNMKVQVLPLRREMPLSVRPDHGTGRPLSVPFGSSQLVSPSGLLT